jgi:RNA polymerase sigma-70 factor (ECF subfamily)
MLEHPISWTSAVQTETQLIARELRSRDAVLLHDLVERFQIRLVRYLVFFLGRRDPVDDLVQETWLRVVERGKSYDGRSPFQAWLFAIARNLAIDHLRRKKGMSLDSTDNAEKSAPAEFLTSAAASPYELAARTEDAGNLAASLAKLQPIYREALLLRFQESLSPQEIPSPSAPPVPTVSSRIHRGLKMLRTHLEGESRAS